MIIKLFPTKESIYVVGGLYDNLPKIKQFIKTCDKSSLFIINGNICYNNVEKNINELNELSAEYNLYYVLSDNDLKYQKNLYENNNYNDIYHWINEQAYACYLTFSNQSSILVLNGGLPDEYNSINTIEDDVRLCLIKNNWHDKYDGSLGYVMSNNPPRQGTQLNLYNYSCGFGTPGSQDDAKTVIQAISRQGLGVTHFI